MWGHDLRRVGRIDDAIAAFKKTDVLEKAYYAAEKIEARYDWHHVHNLDLLAGSYQHKGQMRLAEAMLRETLEFPAVILQDVQRARRATRGPVRAEAIE